jgi:hypothetical protein
VATLNDDIGRTYSGRRQSDRRISAAIESALTDCKSILNVGAGSSGSFLAGISIPVRSRVKAHSLERILNC